MSGDLGAEVVVRAANQALREHPQLELLLVGDENEIEGHVTRIVGDEPRLSIVHASEIVEMSDSPVDAMRKKKDSSMRVAIDLVKEGRAQACVSAGNTGALMGTAKYVLKMLPGIDRPAIITELPAKSSPPRVAPCTCSISARTRYARPITCSSLPLWGRSSRRTLPASKTLALHC
jgi:glycerol-3-phosphate acyltransferase PlsX